MQYHALDIPVFLNMCIFYILLGGGETCMVHIS